MWFQWDKDSEITASTQTHILKEKMTSGARYLFSILNYIK
jgi:hypothetical protein